MRSTSLCPVLGRKHAQVFIGMCPLHTIHPFGKKLQISFLGGRPYITYDPLGGTDFILTRLLVKKHGFIPTFIPAKTNDIVKSNRTISRLWHWVRMWRKHVPTCGLILMLIGFDKGKWTWYWADTFFHRHTQLGWLPPLYVCLSYDIKIP